MGVLPPPSRLLAILGTRPAAPPAMHAKPMGVTCMFSVAGVYLHVCIPLIRNTQVAEYAIGQKEALTGDTQVAEYAIGRKEAKKDELSLDRNAVECML